MARCLYYFREYLSSPRSIRRELVAISHRADDVETKWILITAGELVTYDQIKQATHFLEQYFTSTIELL